MVSKANQYARDRALTPFVVYQGRWNVMERSFEREIIHMALSEGDSEAFYRYGIKIVDAPGGYRSHEMHHLC